MARKAAEAVERLRSWSFSTHQKLEQCPKRVHYQKIQGLPDPPGPAAEAGNLRHAALERYVLDEGSFPPQENAWQPELDHILRTAEDVKAELELGFEHRAYRGRGERSIEDQWIETDFKRGPIRAKLDLVAIVGRQKVRVIDFKTGKQYPEHKSQLSLYAFLTFLKYPWCETVDTEDWYLDRPGEVLEERFTRKRDFEALHVRWGQAVVADMSRTVWPAKRNQFCRWCPYNSRKGGPCTEGAG